jgi:ribose-phosphate pyrophosphokinase
MQSYIMPKGKSSIEVLATEASGYLAAKIAQQLGATHRHTVRRLFSNGERYYKIDIEDTKELSGKDVVFVGATHTDDDLLELYRVGSSLADLGTRRRIFVIPYFGYSTMERADKAGEVVTAKTNARLLSTIPNTNLGNVFLFLDLHKRGLLHYFEGDSLAVELSGQDLFIAAIKKLKLKKFMMASADLGTPGRIQSLANHFDTDIAFVRKTRDFEKTNVVAVIGDVKGHDVVIYDDMVRSGGSLIQAARAYKAQGAKRVVAVISHLALNNQEVVRLLQKSSIEKVITTNSHPMSQISRVQKSAFFEVLDVASLFSASIKESFVG